MSSSLSSHLADFFQVWDVFFVSSHFLDPDLFEPVYEELKFAHTIGLDFNGFETFQTCSARATAPGLRSYVVAGELPQGQPLGE